VLISRTNVSEIVISCIITLAGRYDGVVFLTFYVTINFDKKKFVLVELAELLLVIENTKKEC